MHTPVLTTTPLHTSAAATTPFTNSIPPDTSLVGFIVYMQGTVHPPSSPLYLTNLRVRVGY